MKKYFTVVINETGKSLGNNNEGYSPFNRVEEMFDTIKAVKTFLAEKYGNCKKVVNYQLTTQDEVE